MLQTCQKRGFGMPSEFLSQNKEELTMRAQECIKFFEFVQMIPVNNFGTKLSTFAGANMNSLWATIVLGEWFANYERTS